MVEIKSITFTDEFSGSGATKNPFIMGSVGDKLTAYTTVSVHWESLNVIPTFNSADKTITRKDNVSWLDCEFSDGDTFAITGTASNDGNYTIASVTDSVITTVEALVDEAAPETNFYGTTPINSLNFYYKTHKAPAKKKPHGIFDEVDPSQVDNETFQKFTGGKTIWAVSDVVSLTPDTPSIGWLSYASSCSAVRNANVGYERIFVITQTSYITPFFLAGDSDIVTRLLAGTPGRPKYFDNINYVAQVDAKLSVINPNIIHSTKANATFQNGNVGWFNEFLNGGTPEYSLISASYVSYDSLASGSFSVLTTGNASQNISFASAIPCMNFTLLGVPVQASPTALASYIAANTFVTSGGRWKATSSGTAVTFYPLKSVGSGATTVTISATSSGTAATFSAPAFSITGGSPTAPTVNDLNKTSTVTVHLYSKSGSFTTDTPMTVNMIYAPLDQSDYVNTYTNFTQNFKYDRKMITTNQCPVGGEQIGTDLQSLTNIAATYVDANHITVTFNIDYATAIKTFLKAKSSANRNYLIWITPQKHSVTDLAGTDRNAVLVDFQNNAWDRDDATLLTWGNTLFYQYPNETTNGFTNYVGWNGDNPLAKTIFQILKPAKLNDFSVQVRAVGPDSYFVLDQVDIDLTGQYTTDNQMCSDVVLAKPRAFRIPTVSPRNQTSLERNTAFDTATLAGYEVDDGFMLRYEQWVNVPEFAEAFTCNHAEDWSIYSLRAGWAVKYVLVANVESDGYVTTFERTSTLTIQDGAITSDGLGAHLTSAIETYVDGGSGYNSIEGFIAQDYDTHVVMTLTGDFSAFPAGITGYGGYLALDIQNRGGEHFLDAVTTEEDPVDSSMWIAKAVLTVVDATHITIVADIDHTMIDLTTNRYLLSGRLIYKP